MLQLCKHGTDALQSGIVSRIAPQYNLFNSWAGSNHVGRKFVKELQSRACFFLQARKNPCHMHLLAVFQHGEDAKESMQCLRRYALHVEVEGCDCFCDCCIMGWSPNWFRMSRRDTIPPHFLSMIVAHSTRWGWVVRRAGPWDSKRTGEELVLGITAAATSGFPTIFIVDSRPHHGNKRTRNDPWSSNCMVNYVTNTFPGRQGGPW